MGRVVGREDLAKAVGKETVPAKPATREIRVIGRFASAP